MIVLYCFSPLKTPVISSDVLLPKAIFIFAIFKSNMTALLNFWNPLHAFLSHQRLPSCLHALLDFFWGSSPQLAMGGATFRQLALDILEKQWKYWQHYLYTANTHFFHLLVWILPCAVKAHWKLLLPSVVNFSKWVYCKYKSLQTNIRFQLRTN